MAPRLTNQYLYSPLAEDQIRVLRLPPPGLQTIRPLPCKLEIVDPLDYDYEALSYCWADGKKRATQTTIHLNGEASIVSEHLSNALETLCLPDRSRVLWVDAICINQEDNDEKSAQVAKMRDIYSNAKHTVVWVGQAGLATSKAFEQTRKLYDAAPEQKSEIWNEEGGWIGCLNEIIQRPYWSRGWTVQEVVVSPDSILFCGPHSIPFFELADVLLHPDARKHLNITYRVYAYLDIVRRMRAPDWRDPELGLWQLAYTFSLRQLTHPLDHVYAYRGLIKSPDLLGPAAIVNYNWGYRNLWREMSRHVMVKLHSTVPLALAERSERTSLVDYRWYLVPHSLREPNNGQDQRAVFWSGGIDNPAYYPLQVNDFSAAGNTKARITSDPLKESRILVQGFVCDEIVTVGKAVDEWLILLGRPNYVKLFSNWEVVAGGPWPSDAKAAKPEKAATDSLTPSEIFALTITGGAWTQVPLDWRHWNTLNRSERFLGRRFWQILYSDDEQIYSISDDLSKPVGYELNRRRGFETKPAHAEYDHIRDNACEGRRMARFRSGKFGLVNSYAKVGDSLVVLLGCAVPMVLHPKEHSEWSRKIFRTSEEGPRSPKTTWRLRGQAYVHELMHYHGDLQREIDDGVLELETFTIEGS
ncbi:heterokaryon incompatibility protein-domain-containing protein [Xylariaceae sp. FL0804]|nr:heterokaryon incompatibility protein-domain-containing protein [Xylariaceae sp. FL0804]